MSKVLSIIIEYLIVFIILFLLMYFVFTTSGMKNKKVNKNNKKNGKKKNKNSDDDVPLELVYLTGIYGIDPKNVILKVCIAIVVLILLIIVCYGLLGRYYIYKEDNLINKEDEKDV